MGLLKKKEVPLERQVPKTITVFGTELKLKEARDDVGTKSAIYSTPDELKYATFTIGNEKKIGGIGFRDKKDGVMVVFEAGHPSGSWTLYLKNAEVDGLTFRAEVTMKEGSPHAIRIIPDQAEKLEEISGELAGKMEKVLDVTEKNVYNQELTRLFKEVFKELLNEEEKEMGSAEKFFMPPY